jgi:hypothetical protein
MSRRVTVTVNDELYDVTFRALNNYDLEVIKIRGEHKVDMPAHEFVKAIKLAVTKAYDV